MGNVNETHPQGSVSNPDTSSGESSPDSSVEVNTIHLENEAKLAICATTLPLLDSAQNSQVVNSSDDRQSDLVRYLGFSLSDYSYSFQSTQEVEVGSEQIDPSQASPQDQSVSASLRNNLILKSYGRRIMILAMISST